MLRHFILAGLLFIQIVVTAAEPAATTPPDLFSNDSRRLSQVAKAVVLTDFSKAEPASALITGKREKGKWKLIPFTTAEMKGTALSIYSATNPPRGAAAAGGARLARGVCRTRDDLGRIQHRRRTASRRG